MVNLNIQTSTNSFVISGTRYAKGALTIKETVGGIAYGGQIFDYNQVYCNGVVMNSKQLLINWLNDNIFKSMIITKPIITLMGTLSSNTITIPSDVNEILIKTSTETGVATFYRELGIQKQMFHRGVEDNGEIANASSYSTNESFTIISRSGNRGGGVSVLVYSMKR